MTDESLRLPSTAFRAVFNLGDREAATVPLPPELAHPELYASCDEDDDDDDDDIVHVSVGYESGALHLEANAEGVRFHFHGGRDEDDSPWSEESTAQLLTWAFTLTAEIYLYDLLDQVADAAHWFEHGFTLYVPETDPTQLTLFEVLIEGELLTLPWLGSGHVDHEHVDDDDDDGAHGIALLWNPLHETPTNAIAYAWLDSESGETVTRAEAGVDWSAVGLSEAEVLAWLEGIYENHHVGQTPEQQILVAALEVLGGVRPPLVV